MSIGQSTVGETSVSEQTPSAGASTKKPPPKRQTLAIADAATQPEAR